MKRVINLTIGNVDVAAGEHDDTATLVFSGGARINTGVSKRETIAVLIEFGYVAEHYRDYLEDTDG